MAAGLTPAADLPPELPDAVREQAARAELDEEDLQVAWEIARLPQGLDDADRVALAALVLLTQDALAQGSTRLSLDEAAIEERAKALGMDAALRSRITNIIVAARQGAEPLAPLFGVPGQVRPLILEAGFLYQHRLLALELEIASTISDRLARPPDDAGIDDALARVLERPSAGVVPTGEQRSAIACALAGPLAVISGGPGTGKTSIVVALLRAELARGRLGPESIALAAPTGKAADRMRASIDIALSDIADPLPTDHALRAGLTAPRTLHRLLGYSPHRRAFRHHAGNPLSERLIVVDESSMIDVFLMERLVSALLPDARLVLLGDAEQLPSVAAGAVFRDLGRSPRVPSVRLTQSHRMDPRRPEGANILRVAAHVNAGRAPRSAPVDPAKEMLLSSDPDGVGLLDALPVDTDLGGVLAIEALDTLARERFLDAWMARVLSSSPRRLWEPTYHRADARLVPEDATRVAPLFDAAEKSRLLCVTRSAARPTGVDALNTALHRRHAEVLGRDPGRWLAAEPILVSHNDYERGLFNGDQGLLLWTAAEGESPRLTAVFRKAEGLVAHPLDLVRSSLELGFATTVHKAQGSEHDLVALVLPDADTRLLTREILYTALTRARRAALVVGDLELFARGLRRRIRRSTGIAERLSPI